MALLHRKSFFAVRSAATPATNVLVIGVLALAGCARKPPPPPPPQVGYVVAQPTSVTLPIELTGRTTAYRIAQVRPQITGVIQQRLFAEGAMVHAGQPLYRIDSSLYRAAAAQAAANVASAQASAEATGAKAARYRPLAADQAVSAQDYTDAASAARQARASVAQTSAALRTARINLRFTTVPAPITGRIGRSLYTEGALVTASQTDPLATISQMDPIYVDIQQSAADLLRLRRQVAGGASQSTLVHLKLDDGNLYPFLGQLEFSEVTVDPATATVALRVRFPNHQGLLMPGLFVRAVLDQTSQPNIFLVPQAAITRDARGVAQLFVVKDGAGAAPAGPAASGPPGAGARPRPAMHVELRQVNATTTLGSNWVVTSGLNKGDRVVTQGLGRVRPGQGVRAVPEDAPQGPGPAMAGRPAQIVR